MPSKRRDDAEFRRRVGALRVAAPDAADFLTALADDPPANVVLSPVSNAHLYVRGAFVANIKLGGAERSGTLRWSPCPNLRIAGGTYDAGYALLPGAFDALVTRHGGWAAGWAERRTDGTRVLHPATPRAFFADLRATIEALDPREVPASSPLSPQP